MLHLLHYRQKIRLSHKSHSDQQTLSNHVAAAKRTFFCFLRFLPTGFHLLNSTKMKTKFLEQHHRRCAEHQSAFEAGQQRGGKMNAGLMSLLGITPTDEAAN